MSRIFRPTRSSLDWKDLSAGGERHWKDGHSAKLLAESWDGCADFPPAIRAALGASGDEALAGARLLIGIPEWQVRLPGRGHASQNDLFCLAGLEQAGRNELLVVMIEGKAREPFGPTVAEWLADAGAGKRGRLEALTSLVGLESADGGELGAVRYQLLHRTASALLTAREFAATRALVLVHAFGTPDRSFGDFARFTGLVGVPACRGAVVGPRGMAGVSAYFGWADDGSAEPMLSDSRMGDG